MNTLRLTALTPAHVDTLKRALRIAIRNDKITLRHDARHMQPGALANARDAIRAMEQLADGLSPSAPPSLPASPEPEPEPEPDNFDPMGEGFGFGCVSQKG